ncbi:MAG: hypothetical protein ACLFV4_13300, partial [Candidatus Hydrogenedentota bacterium]
MMNTWGVRGVLLSMTLGVAAMGVFPAGADSLLWEQAPLEGGGSFITDHGNLDYAASFDAGPGWRVDELTWWGANTNAESAVESAAFDITIFGDDGTGAPGAEVASIMGQVSVEDAGFQTDLTHGTLGEDNTLMREAYEFSLELDDPVTLGPGLHHISVDLPGDSWPFSWMVSDVSADSSAWLMSTASPTNGIQAFDTGDSLQTQEQP